MQHLILAHLFVKVKYTTITSNSKKYTITIQKAFRGARLLPGRVLAAMRGFSSCPP